MKKSTKREIMMAKMPKTYLLSDESEYYKLLEDLALAVAPINLPVSECEVWDWIEKNVMIIESVNELSKELPNKFYLSSTKDITNSSTHNSSAKHGIEKGYTIVLHHPNDTGEKSLKLVISSNNSDNKFDREFSTARPVMFTPLFTINSGTKYYGISVYNDKESFKHDLLFIIKGISAPTILLPEEDFSTILSPEEDL